MVQKDSLKKIVIICGPTASGKTSLAVSLAKKLDTEVISADSLNVYKGLDIGTAKPTEEEKKGVRHHLIDVVSPFSEFSVVDYKNLALPVIEKLLESGKIPIVCGGTGFYINSILYDLSYGNGEADEKLRNYYKDLAERKGKEFVYGILKSKDPAAAEKLHPNDLKRVIRALEIAENGEIKSEIKDDFLPIYDYKAYSIDFPTEVLYERIEKRVDNMIKSGLVDEVKGLLSSGLTRENQCMQGIGYKEICGYLFGEYDLSTAIDMIKLNTRHYAKRQKTFFKKLSGLTYLKPDDPKILAEKIAGEL